MKMLSVTGVFPYLICSIVCVTSCSVGTPVALSRLVWVVSSYGNSIQNF